MKNIFNLIIPRHEISIDIEDFFLCIYYALRKKNSSIDQKVDKFFKNNFNCDIVYKSSSFRAIFYNVLLYLNNSGKKRILFPENSFEPLVLAAKDIGFEIFYYNLDKNLEIETFSLEKTLKRIVPDILVLSQHYGNYDQKSKMVKKICSKKNIIILEDQAHSLFNFKKNGDISFFSFGTGKDICTLYGGLCAFNKRKFSDLYDFLKKIEHKSKRKDIIINIFKSMPEIIFSTFPFYHLFVFPMFYLLNFLYGPKKIEQTFFKSDSKVTKKMFSWNTWQSIMFLSSFKKNIIYLKKRKQLGNIFNKKFKYHSLKNISYLCNVYIAPSEKSKWAIKKELLKNGIDSRDDYLTFFKDHILKNKLIFIPNNCKTSKKQFNNTLKILKSIVKKFD